ncbi:MAG: preprotein translocase subunit SecE [Actinobacteria bacterium]|nr:preprotein translocase subunit SecE [Actinomycetota bacterium]OPZ78104.1 MAG: preprotein translocase subunit SecE [Actinobacteria bacterium ADurb.Bin444]
MAKETATKVTSKPRSGLGAAMSRARSQQAAKAQQTQASKGNRFRRYLREVKVEMSKVTWPNRAEVVQATSVVIVAVLIAAAYIGVLDVVWSSLVKLVRLG